jgi:hypothetical protein
MMGIKEFCLAKPVVLVCVGAKYPIKRGIDGVL